MCAPPPRSFRGASSSDNEAAPRNNPWKVGAVGNKRPTRDPATASIPLGQAARQGQAFLWAASFCPPPSWLLSLPFPLSPSQVKGFWLLAPLPGNQTGLPQAERSSTDAA